MSKIGIIIQREYVSRVMKKSFLLLTFLTPIFMAAMIILPMWITTLKDETIKNIVVVDNTRSLRDVLKSSEQYTFVFTDTSIDDIRKERSDKTTSNKKNELSAVLYISEDLVENPNAVTIYSEKQINVELKSYIANQLNNYVRDKKLEALNIQDLKEKIEQSKSNIKITTIKWDSSGKEKEGSAEMALIIGMVSAFLIYIFIMSYGSQVMSGVLQEKTSRIVEVIISSVKPFELMMGKIIGIALVGLTQFTIWIVFTLILTGIGTAIFGPGFDTSSMPEAVQMGQTVSEGDSAEMISKVMTMLSGFDFVKVSVLFLLYFLGGYLLYASLFAAIGSAVDNETDTQQFSMPITLPIIFALFIGIYASQSPDSALAFWGSMIPFTSPVVMMARVPYDVPMWQILLSLAVLVGSFIASTWLAGKIYRTGILMYGKKVSWKELWKWLRVK